MILTASVTKMISTYLNLHVRVDTNHLVGSIRPNLLAYTFIEYMGAKSRFSKFQLQLSELMLYFLLKDYFFTGFNLKS